MKKSVRIRKAGPGETPGYYNKTATFLNKALPKANMGMQVNNMQERLKVIMSDTYVNLRDGMDPNVAFENLVTKYGVDQEMAFNMINIIMKKLAQQGYKNPAILNEDEEDDDYPDQNNTPAPEPTKQAAPNVGTPNEDEELALSEADMESGVDPGTEEYAQASAFQYGGYYDEGGELDYDYPNYFDNTNSTEQDVLEQYNNPGQLSAEDQMPFDLSRLIKFTPGAQNFPQTPDLNYYLGNYEPVSNENDIPQDLLPSNKYGGLNKFAGGGPGPGRGGGGKGKGKGRRAKKATEKEAASTPPDATPDPTTELPTRQITPQESTVSPSTWQKIQNFYAERNPLSNRGFFGTRTENLGTVLNAIRPQNWREKWREQVTPSTTSAKILLDINSLVKDENYEPSVLQKNSDGTYNTGLGFNLDPSISQYLAETAQEILSFKGTKKKLFEDDPIFKGSFLNQLLPESISPELDFLSVHRMNNGKISFIKDKTTGLFKIEIKSQIPTRLKGYKNNSITIKDEILVDPKTKELVDPNTKLPLTKVDKSYYMGNQLNWYNSPYRFPFTKKYPGLDLSTYPQIMSESPLKKDPVSGWNVAGNLLGLPMVLTPMSLPFTYPRFAARSKFYPNASNIKTQFLAKEREIGPQAPGGMTFGDQTFGDQYADYNLLKNRNYETGKSFLKMAGILGGLGYLGYNQYLRQPDQDQIYDRGEKQFEPISPDKFIPKGRTDKPGFGRTISPFTRDSMTIQGKDTIYDKGWNDDLLPENYKKGGAQKKQFVKNVISKFAPGGESQDNSFGKGTRYDNSTNDVSKKKTNFINKLQTQADKAATEQLYDAVQKSGDPKLMNIFMGQNENQNPQPQMQQQFTENGGYIDMDAKNPLTKFISGGDEADFYEPYSLPEARNGMGIGNAPSAGEIRDYISGIQNKMLQPSSGNMNEQVVNNDCPPGFVWSEKYQQCVPLMKTVYKPRIVRGMPSLASTLLPWNPIFRSYLTTAPKMSRRDNPYSRKNLRQFSKDFGTEDRYRVLPMLMARDSGRGEPSKMRQFLTRSLPFGALLQPKYRNGGILSDPSQGDINLASSNVSPYEYNPNVPQNNMVDNSFIPVTDFRDQTTLNSNMFANPNQDQKNDTNYYDPTQYRKVTTMDGEAFNNVFNAGLNATSGFINNLQNNPRSLATTYQATNLLRQVPISNQTDMGDQQDIGQNTGFRGPEQGNDRNSRATFGNYPGAAPITKYGGPLPKARYGFPEKEPIKKEPIIIDEDFNFFDKSLNYEKPGALEKLALLANIGTIGTANTIAKTIAPIMINPARIPLFGARIENVGPFTGSPLNKLPFYGKELEASPDVAYRKFGDTLDYVKLRGELNPADGPLLRMGKNQMAEEGNWAELNQPNEVYPGVFAAKFDFNAPGTNLGYSRLPRRDGVLITNAQGERMPSIPITDPGLSFHRRLPFSNKYISVNKNNRFDPAGMGGNLQALMERYGYAAGYAAALGLMGFDGAQQYFDDYVSKPFNKYLYDPYMEYFEKNYTPIIDTEGYKDGGSYEEGKEVDMTPEELEQFLKAGGQVEYL